METMKGDDGDDENDGNEWRNSRKIVGNRVSTEADERLQEAKRRTY